jgi:hypothetical protein
LSCVIPGNQDIDIVVLASDGGSVWEGLNMAGIIHDKGIATYVPELPEKLGCYSACSFMFFGGKIRQADGIWGRRTQAAAVLFAKTAKLPTEKKQLISDSFIQQLRLAPSGFVQNQR